VFTTEKKEKKKRKKRDDKNRPSATLPGAKLLKRLTNGFLVFS
jgi:hypothetical protein